MVPQVWPGSTFICVGCGPSLDEVQIQRCRDAVESLDARIIVINDAYRLLPMADVLYGCDSRWWLWHEGVSLFPGIKVGLAWSCIDNDWFPGWDKIDYTNIRFLISTGKEGLETNPRGIRTGNNSGYQAINLAVHLGAKTIVLLGYDMKRSEDGNHHWFGDHPCPDGILEHSTLSPKAKKDLREKWDKVHLGFSSSARPAIAKVSPPPYEIMLPAFDTLVDPLKKLEIEVFNCSPGSALKTFPIKPIEEVL